MPVARKIIAGGLLVASLVGLGQLQAPAVHAQTPTPTPTDPGYTTTNIGTLGGHDGFASDINDFGRVSGYAENESSDYHAFMWRRGTKTEIWPVNTSENDRSYGYGINDTGYVVGKSGTSSQYQAFFWNGDDMLGLGTLGGTNSSASDISNGERIIGTSDTANGESHAFMWYRGTMTDLGTLGGPSSAANEINDHKVIVGTSSNANGQSRAVIWKNGHIIDLNVAAPNSYGYGINNHEQIVGTMVLTDGIPRAFLWEDGVTTDLSISPNTYTYANDINDAGIIVGSTYSSEARKATVWHNGTVLYLWPGEDAWADYDTGAVAINESNQIVGYQEYDDGWVFLTDAMLWKLTE
ncbi:HAF repeat-containing protein [Herpetosiphon geysericola]|uniref:HAF repeat-containing protein n=1 Tax=Herpetosiphon geysericola TaxID=70996 RepID=UPI0006C8F5E9|nr:HAF repeat-containing protein [Herpetosiphon geysericola]